MFRCQASNTTKISPIFSRDFEELRSKVRWMSWKVGNFSGDARGDEFELELDRRNP